MFKPFLLIVLSKMNKMSSVHSADQNTQAGCAHCADKLDKPFSAHCADQNEQLVFCSLCRPK